MSELTKEIAERLTELRLRPGCCPALLTWTEDQRRILVVHDMPDDSVIVSCVRTICNEPPPPPIYKTLGICE